jgi:hypothetical protein
MRGKLGSPATSASGSATAQGANGSGLLAFSKCMRANGVPNFPDPKVISGSGGNQEAYLPGVNIQSPAVQSAAKACGGGPEEP